VFRAPSISQAFSYFWALLTNGTGSSYMDSYGYLYCLFAIVLLILEWILRDREYSNPAALLHNRAFRWTLYLALILLIITFTGKSQAFIYFQF
jgi:hypothetical protein